MDTLASLQHRLFEHMPQIHSESKFQTATLTSTYSGRNPSPTSRRTFCAVYDDSLVDRILQAYTNGVQNIGDTVLSSRLSVATRNVTLFDRRGVEDLDRLLYLDIKSVCEDIYRAKGITKCFNAEFFMDRVAAPSTLESPEGCRRMEFLQLEGNGHTTTLTTTCADNQDYSVAVSHREEWKATKRLDYGVAEAQGVDAMQVKLALQMYSSGARFAYINGGCAVAFAELCPFPDDSAKGLVLLVSDFFQVSTGLLPIHPEAPDGLTLPNQLQAVPVLAVGVAMMCQHLDDFKASIYPTALRGAILSTESLPSPPEDYVNDRDHSPPDSDDSDSGNWRDGCEQIDNSLHICFREANVSQKLYAVTFSRDDESGAFVCSIAASRKTWNCSARLDLIDIVGQGLHGIVWRTRHPTSGIELVVKLVSRAHIAAVAQESLIYAYLANTRAHSVIPRYFGTYIASGGSWFAIILEDAGMSLERKYKCQDWAHCQIEDDVRTQINRAKRRLHKAGIRHGDLNPRNFAMRPGAHVKIFDFGHASIITS